MKILNPKEWNVSESIKRLNPDVFTQVQDTERKPNKKPTLDNQAQGQKSPQYRVYIISLRSRVISDGDNLIGGAKALRDKIAEFLGVDDKDENIDWRYKQIDVNRGDDNTIFHVVKLSTGGIPGDHTKNPPKPTALITRM